MQPSLYCKIFVSGPTERDQLLTTVTAGLGGAKVAQRTVESDVAVVDVNRNGAEPSDVGPDEAFLAYPYFLDVEPAAEVERAKYVAACARLLTAFWNAGWSAVAACDFEAELPYNGGYRDGELTAPAAKRS